MATSDRTAGAAGQSGRSQPLKQPLEVLKALAHPIRMHILGVLSYRSISPSEFAEDRGEPVSNVSHHFRVLEKLGCIELVAMHPAGSKAVKHFYRRTETIVFDDDSWLYLPDEARQIVASSAVRDLVGRVTAALQAGTFTARDDFHLTWRPLSLDEEGWGEAMGILNRAFEELTECAAQAINRMDATGDDGLVATVALLGFESPRQEVPDGFPPGE